MDKEHYYYKSISGNYIFELTEEINTDSFSQITKEEFDQLIPSSIRLYEVEFDEIKRKIKPIEEWFVMYDNQVKQYERCKRLNIEYDNKLGTIEELDAQAEQKAFELNKLRTELSEKKAIVANGFSISSDK